MPDRSPLLVGGDAPRILDEAALPSPAPLELAHVLLSDDYLFLRYRRR